MTVYRRTTELMQAELGDELVALEPNSGVCFGFNSVAATVWQQLKAPQGFDQIKERLLTEYDVDERQCGADLIELLDRLIDIGLVSADEDE